MRKLIFPLIIASVLLAGCSKDETSPAVDENEKEEVIIPETPVAQEVEALLLEALTAEEIDCKIELVFPGKSLPLTIRMTLADRLRFETEITSLGLFLTAFTEARALLMEDQSEETLTQVRKIVGDFNDNNTISFSLDGKNVGNVTLELVKDNETFSADIVMNYSEDGSKYDMSYFYSDYISSIIKTLQEFYDRIKDNSK